MENYITTNIFVKSIPFEQLSIKLLNNEIVNYGIDPTIQLLGNPNNIILTVKHKTLK
jgi:hypothetical protein